MIDQALHTVKEQLNQFLRLRFDLAEDMVVLSYVINQDGSVATQDENKIIFSLVDISEETFAQKGSQYRTSNFGEYVAKPDLHLNLQVIFTAFFNPNNYTEALKFISSVIEFFHSKPVFTAQNSPALADKGIEKLHFEIFHLDSNSKNNLWATIGGKYMPSIIYKVRMIKIQDQAIQGLLDSIRTIDLDTKKRDS